MSHNEHDIKLLLSAQRALLGEIPPRLRSVSFDLSTNGDELKARFEFDGDPTDEELECASVTMTTIFADYSKNQRKYIEECISVPYPEEPKFLRLVAFYRNEDKWNSWSNGI